MLMSNNVIYLAKFKVEVIVRRRMKKMKKHHAYKVFNRWWSTLGGVSVLHE